ncbi:hypothetical protein PHYSODRAFT_517016 [Phytophthora sojae]|uniref:Cation Diffusion Facilitator (CDF) Family n=1 Tax=Phytophthora sojae (strain P6497) TaxID=1094619 RepID=G4ZVG4_PHYSP|nr:hypothetical protein PHYSODRAFT_517016 [Phytophthora sojae]EGZ11482.1 hypothetical protein PHYSODRAFT_517016 [Phytophthora sojae]|eukprot:XP_009531815.1 hypothetical protein PHYSODRAFT_517016 [Phytophthora sojae]
MGSDKCSPVDDALIDSPRRIPLTESARRAQRKLQLACLCSVVFMCAEVVGGSIAGSLAIMTDAAHLLSDVAGFCISLFAIWMSTLPASNSLSFGFQRADVIGAVVSVLWVLTGMLLYAAVKRFIECLEPHPKEHVDGKLMFIVACIGLLVNIVLMQISGHGHSHGGGGHSHSHGEKTQGHSHGGRSHGEGNHHGHSHGIDAKHGHSHGPEECSGEEGRRHHHKNLENLNIRSAYIHALGDFIQSLGVCVAGGLIWFKPEWQIADPIATFVFSILVVGTTVGIIRDSIHMLMEGTPLDIDTKDIEEELQNCPSVVGVHDLHIWSLSAGLPSLSVHLVSGDPETALRGAQRFLLSKGITHSTIQIETPFAIYPRDCAADLKCGQVSPPREEYVVD